MNIKNQKNIMSEITTIKNQMSKFKIDYMRVRNEYVKDNKLKQCDMAVITVKIIGKCPFKAIERATKHAIEKYNALWFLYKCDKMVEEYFDKAEECEDIDELKEIIEDLLEIKDDVQEGEFLYEYERNRDDKYIKNVRRIKNRTDFIYDQIKYPRYHYDDLKYTCHFFII